MKIASKTYTRFAKESSKRILKSVYVPSSALKINKKSAKIEKK